MLFTFWYLRCFHQSTNFLATHPISIWIISGMCENSTTSYQTFEKSLKSTKPTTQHRCHEKNNLHDGCNNNSKRKDNDCSPLFWKPKLHRSVLFVLHWSICYHRHSNLYRFWSTVTQTIFVYVKRIGDTRRKRYNNSISI